MKFPEGFLGASFHLCIMTECAEKVGEARSYFLSLLHWEHSVFQLSSALRSTMDLPLVVEKVVLVVHKMMSLKRPFLAQCLSMACHNCKVIPGWIFLPSNALNLNLAQTFSIHSILVGLLVPQLSMPIAQAARISIQDLGPGK